MLAKKSKILPSMKPPRGCKVKYEIACGNKRKIKLTISPFVPNENKPDFTNSLTIILPKTKIDR